MSSSSLKPSASVVLAVLVAMAAFSVAAIADSVVVRLVAVFVGGALVVFLVRSAGEKSTGAGFLGVFLVPVLMLGVGTTVVAVATDGAAETGSSPADDESTVTVDFDARFAAALDEADALVPSGSSSILSISLGDTSDTVAVLDPRTGRRLQASRSSGYEWNASEPSPETVRTTFTRADVARFRAQAGVEKAHSAAKAIGLSASDREDWRGLTIAPRYQDKMLVADSGYGTFHHVQIDMRGKLPDTLDAGALDSMVESASRTMKANGLDPADRSVSDVDFMAVDDNASFPGGGSISHSGGIAVEFDAGPVDRIVIAPGEFPVVQSRTSTDSVRETTFAFRRITTQLLTKIRDDVMNRFRSPAYDRAAVGFEIGYDYDHELERYRNELTMSVGPGAADATAVYTLDGRFLRTE